jgi:hypothetical protein
MAGQLGTIEGFFGRPYSWAERTELMRALAGAGYGFYLYAPKGDGYLRRRWRDRHPAQDANALMAFGQACRTAGVTFGVGLSPFELHFSFDAPARAALKAKLVDIDAMGCQWLAILFDDMRGDLSDLARRQAEIVAFACEHTQAQKVIVCPSYYTDDPVLDRVFGTRPDNYLEDLAALLRPPIDIMWTGEEVCSREFSRGHLERVASILGRKPFLWDNYPVNDGPRMSRHLHLRAFTGRSAELADLVSAHAVNPASQPTLTRIPMLTLAMSYAEGPKYAYGQAFLAAARAVCGDDLAAQITADLLSFEDGGLGDISTARKATLEDRYRAFDHPGAREIVSWLQGGYAVEGELLKTQ